MKSTFPLLNFAAAAKILALAVVLSIFALGVLPGKAAAAACSPSDTSSCTSTSCTAAGGAWENPFPGTSHPETCLFTCSAGDSSGCSADNCSQNGGTWENPYNDSTHPETCVFDENTNSGTSSSGSFAAAARSCSSKPRFLGLVPWYEYLTLTSDGQGGCKITQFQSGDVLGTDDGGTKTASPFLLIGLAILQDLVRVAALVAVGFVIFGGFKYITSQGAPEDTKEAQKTIVDALIGLAFAVLAAGIVGFIGNRLG